MALHRLTGLALSVALALGVAGCGNDSPSPSPRTSSAAASPSSSATGPAAPVLPDLAARHDDVGAKAFVKFYFAALTYAMHTGDTSVMERYAEPGCHTCAGISQKIRRIYDANGRNEGGGWIINRVVYMVDSVESLHHLTVGVTQPAQSLVDAEGQVRHRDPETSFVFNVWVTPGRDGWRLREIQTIPTAK